MPFCVALKQSTGVYRAYSMPDEVFQEVATTGDAMERFIMRDPDEIARLLDATQSRDDLAKIGAKMGVRIKSRDIKARRVWLVAEKLVEGLEANPPLTDDTKGVHEDIDDLCSYDKMLLSKLLISIVGGDDKMRQEITALIQSEASHVLNSVIEKLFADDKPEISIMNAKAVLGYINEKVKEEIEALKQGDETPLGFDDLHLNVEGETILKCSLYLERRHHCDVFFDKTTPAKKLYDEFEKQTGLTPDQFSFKWDTEEGASTLMIYDHLGSYALPGQRFYIQLKMLGGAKPTIKLIKKELSSKSSAMQVKTKDVQTNATIVQKYDKTPDMSIKTLITEGKAIAEKLYVSSQGNPDKTLEEMLSKLDSDTLDGSLFEFKTTKPDARVSEFSDKLLNGYVSQLIEAKEALDDTLSSVASVAQLVILGSAMKDNGNMDWAKLKQMAEIETKLRAKTASEMRD
ncbi:unnamed protein product [Symbiodinium sp. CCMP2592]|nr:unnamed protein product [Symbiodinium sp. CCMP2592]